MMDRGGRIFVRTSAIREAGTAAGSDEEMVEEKESDDEINDSILLSQNAKGIEKTKKWRINFGET